MQNIKLTTDSTCDLTPDLVEKLDLDIIRLIVSLGDKNHLDGKDISPDDIYAHVEKNKTLPKTAAPSPEAFREMFARLSKTHDAVIHIGISSLLSASYQNAVLAAKEFSNVTVIDGQSLSTGTSLMLLAADNWRKAGVPAQKIAGLLRELPPFVQASFVVDTLEYLHKGGRCSGLARLGATILRLHPVLYLEKGAITVHKKLRGKIGAVQLEYIDGLLADFPDYDPEFAFVTHSGTAPDELEAVRRRVKEKFKFKNIYTTQAGSTITSHCGKNTIGLLFLRKTT